MYENAKILKLDIQNNIPCIWALCDLSENSIERTFSTVGTGQNIDNYEAECVEYIDTYQENNGNLVWHVFEIIK